MNGARSKLRRRCTARAYVPPHEVPRDGTSEGVLLAEEHREVLVLRYWSGLSEAEMPLTDPALPGSPLDVADA